MRPERGPGVDALPLAGLLAACSWSVSPSATSAPKLLHFRPDRDGRCDPDASLVTLSRPRRRADRLEHRPPRRRGANRHPSTHRVPARPSHQHGIVIAQPPRAASVQPLQRAQLSEKKVLPLGPQPDQGRTQVAGAIGSSAGAPWSTLRRSRWRTSWSSAGRGTGGHHLAIIWIWPSDLDLVHDAPGAAGYIGSGRAVQPGRIDSPRRSPAQVPPFVLGPCSLVNGADCRRRPPAVRFPLHVHTVGARNGDWSRH